MNKIKLGSTVVDKITGFEGLAIGVATYITGCDQYLVQPRCKIKCKYEKPNSEWIDDGRLMVISDEGIDAGEVASDKNGADISAPKK